MLIILSKNTYITQNVIIEALGCSPVLQIKFISWTRFVIRRTTRNRQRASIIMFPTKNVLPRVYKIDEIIKHYCFFIDTNTTQSLTEMVLCLYLWLLLNVVGTRSMLYKRLNKYLYLEYTATCRMMRLASECNIG